VASCVPGHDDCTGDEDRFMMLGSLLSSTCRQQPHQLCTLPLCRAGRPTARACWRAAMAAASHPSTSSATPSTRRAPCGFAVMDIIAADCVGGTALSCACCCPTTQERA